MSPRLSIWTQPVRVEQVTGCPLEARGRLNHAIAGLKAMKKNIQEQLLHRIVKWSRGDLVFKALRHSCHSTQGLRVTKKKKIRQHTKQGGLKDKLTLSTSFIS